MGVIGKVEGGLQLMIYHVMHLPSDDRNEHVYMSLHPQGAVVAHCLQNLCVQMP